MSEKTVVIGEVNRHWRTRVAFGHSRVVGEVRSIGGDMDTGKYHPIAVYLCGKMLVDKMNGEPQRKIRDVCTAWGYGGAYATFKFKLHR